MTNANQLSHELNDTLALALDGLAKHPDAAQVLAGTADARTLASYYVTAHAAVSHAVEFLRDSARAVSRGGHAPELAALLAAKAGEESGHERWLESDLAAIGFPLGRPHTPEPTAAARAYVDFHRSVIPLCGEAFLGTAWVLESLAVHCAGVAAKRLCEAGTIPGLSLERACGLRFLLSHAEEDVGHVAALATALDRHVHGNRARAYVKLCARFTATLYADFFAVAPSSDHSA